MTLNKLLGSLVLVGVTTAGGYQLADEIRPLAEEVSAQESVQRIADAAYLNYQLTGDWQESLEEVLTEMRGTQHVEISGTTVRWFYGEACYESDLPTADTVVEVAPC